MARLKFLFVVLGLNKPSSRKRITDCLDFIRARGHEADLMIAPNNLPGSLRLLAAASRYDLVVIQKKLFGPAMLSLLRAMNKRLVFDLDDAVMFLEVERGEPVTGKFKRRFDITARSCLGVIAGNEYLAEFARAAGARTVVLPTPVDTEAVFPDNGKASERVVIGWIGTKGNLKHLKGIAGPLKKVLDERRKALLRVVSDSRPEMPGTDVDYKPWSASDELADLQGFDIGIMPLADDIWTRGKGGFKLLQYMAAGLPTVASPVGINSEIVLQSVTGFLAGNEEEWVKSLVSLIDDATLRRVMGERGRERAVREYSLGIYRERLARALEDFAAMSGRAI